jgi:exopolyphosphatase / guanosine-5'-triphosphate,3'-diphosphate pyrophosphatase
MSALNVEMRMSTGRHHQSRRFRRRGSQRTGQESGERAGAALVTPGHTAHPPRESGPPVLAALDLGTNNCRLLIAHPSSDTFRVVDAFSRIVRLGQGITNTGTLSDAAMDRTVDALKVCADKMRRRDVNLSRIVATEACRRAGNGAEFIKRVSRETGLDLEVISNREEAELALAGCLPLFDPTIPDAIVFDIGGGSTELAWTRRGPGGERISLEVMSMPIGVVTLTEKYGGDYFEVETYRAMITECMHRLDSFDAAHQISAKVEAGGVQMLGTSGTVTTLAGLRLNLKRYVRDLVDGTSLDFDDVRRLARDLAGMGFQDRAAYPCIGRERADLVVAGCAILEAICEKWPVGRLRVADRGVREGILLGLLSQLG